MDQLFTGNAIVIHPLIWRTALEFILRAPPLSKTLVHADTCYGHLTLYRQ